MTQLTGGGGGIAGTQLFLQSVAPSDAGCVLTGLVLFLQLGKLFVLFRGGLSTFL